MKQTQNERNRRRQILEQMLERLENLCQDQYKAIQFHYKAIERIQKLNLKCEAEYIKTKEAIDRVK
jgi:hypothetical protein